MPAKRFEHFLHLPPLANFLCNQRIGGKGAKNSQLNIVRRCLVKTEKDLYQQGRETFTYLAQLVHTVGQPHGSHSYEIGLLWQQRQNSAVSPCSDANRTGWLAPSLDSFPASEYSCGLLLIIWCLFSVESWDCSSTRLLQYFFENWSRSSAQLDGCWWGAQNAIGSF
jgi:hypothetical protein